MCGCARLPGADRQRRGFTACARQRRRATGSGCVADGDDLLNADWADQSAQNPDSTGSHVVDMCRSYLKYDKPTSVEPCHATSVTYERQHFLVNSMNSRRAQIRINLLHLRNPRSKPAEVRLLAKAGLLRSPLSCVSPTCAAPDSFHTTPAAATDWPLSRHHQWFRPGYKRHRLCPPTLHSRPGVAIPA